MFLVIYYKLNWYSVLVYCLFDYSWAHSRYKHDYLYKYFMPFRLLKVMIKTRWLWAAWKTKCKFISILTTSSQPVRPKMLIIWSLQADSQMTLWVRHCPAVVVNTSISFWCSCNSDNYYHSWWTKEGLTIGYFIRHSLL